MIKALEFLYVIVPSAFIDCFLLALILIVVPNFVQRLWWKIESLIEKDNPAR